MNPPLHPSGEGESTNPLSYSNGVAHLITKYQTKTLVPSKIGCIFRTDSDSLCPGMLTGRSPQVDLGLKVPLDDADRFGVWRNRGMVLPFLGWPIPRCRVLTGCSDRADPYSHTFGSRLFGSLQDGQPSLLLSAEPLAFDCSPRKSSVPDRVHLMAALRGCSDLAAQESPSPSRPTLEWLTAWANRLAFTQKGQSF